MPNGVSWAVPSVLNLLYSPAFSERPTCSSHCRKQPACSSRRLHLACLLANLVVLHHVQPVGCFVPHLRLSPPAAHFSSYHCFPLPALVEEASSCCNSIFPAQLISVQCRSVVDWPLRGSGGGRWRCVSRRQTLSFSLQGTPTASAEENTGGGGPSEVWHCRVAASDEKCQRVASAFLGHPSTDEAVRELFDVSIRYNTSI